MRPFDRGKWGGEHRYVAAINMVGRPMPNLDIPFFWTRLWDRTLSYSGYAVGYDEVIIDGSLKDLKFVAYYAKQDKIVASASMNVGNVMGGDILRPK